MFRTPELTGSEISPSVVRMLCFSLCLSALDSAVVYTGRFPACRGRRDLQQFQIYSALTAGLLWEKVSL